MVSLGVQRLREAVSSQEVLIVLARSTGGEMPNSMGLTFREATPEDGPRYAHDIATDSASSFRARLSDRTRCFVVVAESRLVHATWMTSAAAWTREVRAYFRPPPDEAYIYESFTRADVRGRGVYPFALAGISGWLAGRGIERVWVAVEAHNPPSLRAVSKAGFEEVDRIHYARRMGRLHVEGPRCPSGEPTSLCLALTPGAM